MLLGNEMCVIGFECGEGMSCGDRKLRQYLCSEVIAAGPDGSFIGWRAVTVAAMVIELMWIDVTEKDSTQSQHELFFYR